jgi:hypothetical protein
MKKKKNFMLRVNADTMATIEKWADEEFRSTNGQIEWIIEHAILDAKRKKINC